MGDLILENSPMMGIGETIFYKSLQLWELKKLYFRHVHNYGRMGDFFLEKSTIMRIWENIF